MSGSDTINGADAMPVTATKKVVRRVYRVRIFQLPHGSYAIEYKQWPWSFWHELHRVGKSQLEYAKELASDLLYSEVFEVSKKGGDA